MPRQARKKAESGIYHSCGHDKAVKLVAELDNGKGIGLIERKNRGKEDRQKSMSNGLQALRLPKAGNQDFRKSDCNYNNINYTDSIYPESVNPSILPSTENLVRARAEGDGLTDGL